MERAYPVTPEPKPKGRKPKEPLFPVVMFSTVPYPVVREWNSNVSNDERCQAAIRPWINGMGQIGQWARCSRKKSLGDCICMCHRKQSDVTGFKAWNDLHLKQTGVELGKKRYSRG